MNRFTQCLTGFSVYGKRRGGGHRSQPFSAGSLACGCVACFSVLLLLLLLPPSGTIHSEFNRSARGKGGGDNEPPPPSREDRQTEKECNRSKARQKKHTHITTNEYASRQEAKGRLEGGVGQWTRGDRVTAPQQGQKSGGGSTRLAKTIATTTE